MHTRPVHDSTHRQNFPRHSRCLLAAFPKGRVIAIKCAFDRYDPAFRERCKQTTANIVIGGENFACGSSREQAVYAIQENNVVCVIAQSYPDIFYRNSLSNGLVLITLPDTSSFQMGDELHVDLDTYTIENVTQGTTFRFEMNPDDCDTFKQGGMIGRVKHHLAELLQASK